MRKGGDAYDGTRGALYVFGTHIDTDRRRTQGQYGVNWDTKRYPDVAGPGKGVVGLSTPVEWQDWMSTTGNGGGFAGARGQLMEGAGFVELPELSLSLSLDHPPITNPTGFRPA